MRFRFPKHDGPPPHNRQSRLGGGGTHPFVLLRRIHRKYAREQSARSKPARRNIAVIANIPPQFESTGNLLRMIPLNSRPSRKIRWTAQHQIELLVRTEHLFLAKIPCTQFDSFRQPVPLHRFSRQRHTLGLCFDRHKPRSRQPPRREHRHRSNSTSKIQRRFHPGRPRTSIPRRQNIIRRKPMPLLELKNPEVPSQGIQSLTISNHRPIFIGPRRNWAWNLPPTKLTFHGHLAQTLVCSLACSEPDCSRQARLNRRASIARCVSSETVCILSKSPRKILNAYFSASISRRVRTPAARINCTAKLFRVNECCNIEANTPAGSSSHLRPRVIPNKTPPNDSAPAAVSSTRSTSHSRSNSAILAEISSFDFFAYSHTRFIIAWSMRLLISGAVFWRTRSAVLDSAAGRSKRTSTCIFK